MSYSPSPLHYPGEPLTMYDVWLPFGHEMEISQGARGVTSPMLLEQVRRGRQARTSRQES